MLKLLETERLVLRRFTEDDAKHVFELDNDAEVMRFINGGIPISMHMVQNDIMPVFLTYDELLPGLGFFAVVEKASASFVGWCCLRPVKPARREASVGYRFRSACWGVGYATEASRALMFKGFADAGLERIIADTYEFNTASRRVMEKLGLRFIKTFKVDLSKADTANYGTGETWDGQDVEYAIEKADWDKLHHQGLMN